MKSCIIYLAVFAVFCFTACQNASPEPELASPQVDDPVQEMLSSFSTEETLKVKDKDTISVEKFDLWIANWKKSVGKNPVTKDLLYFTMPVIDFSELLNEKPKKVRLYLGLDETVQPNEPHLMVVGVDSSGHNMISDTNYIYDISQPCPPGCGGGGDQ